MLRCTVRLSLPSSLAPAQMYLISPVIDLNRLLPLEPTNRPALDEFSAMVMRNGQSSNINWPGDEELRDIEHPLEIDDSDIDPFNALAIGNRGAVQGLEP